MVCLAKAVHGSQTTLEPTLNKLSRWPKWREERLGSSANTLAWLLLLLYVLLPLPSHVGAVAEHKRSGFALGDVSGEGSWLDGENKSVGWVENMRAWRSASMSSWSGNRGKWWRGTGPGPELLFS